MNQLRRDYICYNKSYLKTNLQLDFEISPCCKEERDNEVVSHHLPARLNILFHRNQYIYEQLALQKGINTLQISIILMVKQIVVQSGLCHLILVDLTSLTLRSPSHPQENLQPQRQTIAGISKRERKKKKIEEEQEQENQPASSLVKQRGGVILKTFP